VYGLQERCLEGILKGALVLVVVFPLHRVAFLPRKRSGRLGMCLRKILVLIDRQVEARLLEEGRCGVTFDKHSSVVSGRIKVGLRWA
jgi:hypothetical protein